MAVFTADKGLIPMRFKIASYIRHRSVHLALHIRCLRISSVMKNPLIVDKSLFIQPAELPCHLTEHFSAVGFVAAGPDQDGRMVFIPLIAGTHSVKHGVQPFHTVSRHYVFHGCLPFQHRIETAVGFQIVLRDQIQTVAVAQFIEQGTVGVMAGADRIDIVPLHGQDICQRVRIRDHPTALTAKLMAVDALKNDPLPVQIHDTVF